MEQRYVGGSGLRVSRLGLGTMTWGRDTDEHESREQLAAFLDAGGTLLDTAAGYGDGAAEELIGTLLRDHVRRDDVILPDATLKLLDRNVLNFVESREQLRQLGKVGVAGAHRRRALALVAIEPVEHVHGVIGAALLAVIDDVDAAFDLLLHNMRHRFAHHGREFGFALAGCFLLGQQFFDHLGSARQAAGVGGEKALSAAFH